MTAAATDDDIPPAAPVAHGKKRRKGAPVEASVEDASDDLSRLSRWGWLAGVAGMVTILGLGYLAFRKNVMQDGWGIGSGAPTTHRSVAFVLLVVALVMLVIELAIRFRVDRGRVLSIAPDVRAGRYADFIRTSIAVYLGDLTVLALFMQAYRAFGEYGFGRNQPYYQPWFAIMDFVWRAYLFGGLPYVLLTRALQHDPKADRKQPAFLLWKAMLHVRARLTRLAGRKPEAVEPFDRYDRTAILGTLVKAFYVPLMTVFFADQFGSLVKNYAFVTDRLFGEVRKPIPIRDAYNVAESVIFAVDVGLAWAGYTLSSRWIKNTMWSVEPTLVGWTVALLCYPPFNRTFGLYFSTPGESAFFAITYRPIVLLFASFSIASFAVYSAATVFFGLRFSNLTHRGIITTGPYAHVRHPAYAAKNFSWWCVMLPYIVWEGVSKGSPGVLVQLVGLVALSGLYYLRALTEERHLSKDPEYRAYMEKVPWRFIPGLV